MRKKIEAGIKAKVALEAFRDEKTLAQIASEYGIHPNLISRWKQELLKRARELFGRAKDSKTVERKELVDKLHRTIGELKVENDWLKKKLDFLG